MPLFSIETAGQLHPFLNHEWLLTNGLGAFASSTVVGCNTRRYHGLLCAATIPPVGRIVTLNRIGELVFLDGSGQFLELSVNRFRNAVHPRGDRYLQRFDLDLTATWHYNVEGVTITKQLLLAWRKNLAGVRYSIQADRNDRAVELHLAPFVSLRDYHALRQQAGSQFQVTADGWAMSVADDRHKLHFRADAGGFQRREDWWYGHTYPVETERGLDDGEDLFVPGILMHKLAGQGVVTIWATTDEPQQHYDWDAELAALGDRAKLWMQPTQQSRDGSATVTHSRDGCATTAYQRLLRASDNFIVARRRPDGKDGTSIIAGYPWFADWGRDTMISLPGLLLTTGRFPQAAQVLTVFAEYVSEGMIPNRFDDYTNEPSYNTVDASLWFIHACFEYLRLSKDQATFDSALLPACRAIVHGYRQGTRYHIKMDEGDGLLSAGEAGTQLTWMDAKCNGIVFTPRHGKAVEINALWYHVLRLLGENELADKVRDSFMWTFWRNAFRGLYDVVNGERRDGSIRPNQIFAVSLPNSPLEHEQQQAVVEVVRRELLTPFGLRTLNRDDASYRGHYRGRPMERDAAYHNGVVWPWLIGPFLDAYLRVRERSADAQRQARVWLQPLLDQMNQNCIGQISECYEGDEPHRPVGCPAQAWSVAEVLRLAAELGV